MLMFTPRIDTDHFSVNKFRQGFRARAATLVPKTLRAPGATADEALNPGATTNRTVYTFVGEPEAVVRGALNAARVGHQLIDMSQQKGAHPRIGAMDVCPFIPVKNIRLRFYLVLSLSTFAQ